MCNACILFYIVAGNARSVGIITRSHDKRHDDNLKRARRPYYPVPAAVADTQPGDTGQQSEGQQAYYTNQQPEPG